MPRKARAKSETGIYHVIFRGVNKQNIFEDDEDRRKFLEMLGYYKNLCNYLLYGYCIMGNHIHLVIKEMDETISQIIKRISVSYVHWYNKKYERCGHLFQERFKSEVVETEKYFLVVLRYVHQNPVKAGVVKDASAYCWSSYQKYIGRPGIADIDFALDIFSNDRTKAVNLFAEYTNEKTGDECLDYQARTAMGDEEILVCLNQFGIENISQLQRLNKEERDTVIRGMKVKDNITIRQLARITGISKSVIARV